MVEMARVELASENPLIQPSTWIVYLLLFPNKIADRQAISWVALLCMTDARANSRFMFTSVLRSVSGRGTPERNGWRYSHSTAANHPKGQLVRQP